MLTVTLNFKLRSFIWSFVKSREYECNWNLVDYLWAFNRNLHFPNPCK